MLNDFAVSLSKYNDPNNVFESKEIIQADYVNHFCPKDFELGMMCQF